MKIVLVLATACLLFIHEAQSQSAPPTHFPQATSSASATVDTADIEEMRADIQQLKTLLNQMRTNLAFVQSSQTPLKHQFELEADAWQIVVNRMEHRLRRMEEQKTPR
jgi:hypothetical protein